MARICFILNSHWETARGGAELKAHLLAEHFALHGGDEVHYLANKTKGSTSTYPYSIRGFSGPHFPGSKKFSKLIHAPALYREITRVSPDAIIQMVASAHTGVVAWYAKRAGIPFYFYLSSDMDVSEDPGVGVFGPARILDKRVYLYGLKNSTHIIAQTNRQAELLLRTYGRSCAMVIPNFLPPVQPSQRRTTTFNVSWIANVKGLKRPELFVELARSCADIPGLMFRMSGREADMHLGRLVRRAAADLPNFTYHGELTLEGVESELSDTDVFINTSDYEGFPNTFIQAWLHSVPVLSLNVDPDGIMKKRKIGMQTGDIEKMRERLLALYNDRPELQRMGERAQEYAQEHHSMRNADRIREHLQGQLAANLS